MPINFKEEPGRWVAGPSEDPAAFARIPDPLPISEEFLEKQPALYLQEDAVPGSPFENVDPGCPIRPNEREGFIQWVLRTTN